MSLLVVGSIAIDSVQTPKGEVGEALGGSASYFAYAASYFGPVRVVGVIGKDFPEEYFEILSLKENIDTIGIQRVEGKTFRWKGRYEGDMNVAKTLEVHLNVLGDFDPDIPEEYRDSQFVFLANGSPVVQKKVLHQVRKPKLVVADTMNLWIETQHSELLELLGQVDGIVLNDQEALLLTKEKSLVAAGRKVLELGPKFAVVKKGEHGSIFFSAEDIFPLPAYPTESLVDPTGAGDSFAGGLMGHVANAGSSEESILKQGMAYGTVAASINVEGFSLQRFQKTTPGEIQDRYERYRNMLRID